MNTNGNTYTIVYASVVVILVAFLLAFVSSSLSERQQTNIELDTKKQILSSLNVDYEGKDAAALYDQYITADPVYDSKGQVVSPEGGFDVSQKEESAKPLEERKLAVFVASVDGATKYVIPMRGMGLWGPIWGYVALNEDKATVYGVYFSHEGETPGLGAEITKDAFKTQFKGKSIKRGGELTSIKVVKPGKSDPDADYVDGISGGTMTSQGVSDMLMNGLTQYVEFLK